jgi:hypothetical protein
MADSCGFLRRVRRLVGFLAGATASGAGSYSFLTKEFKAQNDLLLEDLYVRVCI